MDRLRSQMAAIIVTAATVAVSPGWWPDAAAEAPDPAPPAAVGKKPDRVLLTPPGAPGPKGNESDRFAWLDSLQGWGKEHPYDACAWALENLSAPECLRLLGLTNGIAFELGAKDFTNGLVLLEKFKRFDQEVAPGLNPGHRPGVKIHTLFEHLMLKFLAGAAASDPAAAVPLAAKYGGLHELAGHWVAKDPPRAMAWARDYLKAHPESQSRIEAAITWSLANRRSFDAALQWTQSLQEIPWPTAPRCPC